MRAFDHVAPGLYSQNTLLYGVEVKFYSSKVAVGEHFETALPGFYAIGDGAGVTRGLMQASVTGVVVARDIMARLGTPGVSASPSAKATLESAMMSASASSNRFFQLDFMQNSSFFLQNVSGWVYPTFGKIFTHTSFLKIFHAIILSLSIINVN